MIATIRSQVPRLREWATRPVDARPLVVFRVGFGLLMFLAAARFLMKGWVATQYIQPQFHFRYYLFQWVPDLPGVWLYGVFAAQMVSAALIAFGWRYRAAAIGFFLTFSYVELIDQATYLNHYYFISLVSLLLIILPLHHWSSLDVRAGRIPRSRSAPRWISLAFQAQIAIVYFFAGIAKLNPDWLLEAQPLGIWLSARTGFPVLGALFDQRWVAYLMSWAGAAFDLSIPLLLFWRRSRPWAYLAVVIFHVTTALLFPIGVFPWVMIGSALIFFDSADYARLSARLGFRSAAPLAFDRRVRPNLDRASPWHASLVWPRWALVAFFSVQILMPLRHLAYPGSVLWTEEGYRFSWRVMLVEKTGTVIFRVTDPDSGRSWDVFPGGYLNPQQERQLAFQPDMILGFAHHLRDTARANGIREPEVRANAYVSLNGRRARALVDPAVDLARERRSLAPKRWILREPLPKS